MSTKPIRIVQRQPCQAAGNFDGSVSPLLQRIYLNRGITEQSQLATDLSGLPSPDLFKGMEQATALLIEALQNKQRISVVGDFDADGATSTALALHCLRSMGFSVDYLVPNRFEYGYGLTPEIVQEVIRLQQPQLIITVDNGISSVEGVSLAQQHKIKVLITDHHLPGISLPTADAIVNPNQTGCTFPSKNLAGVGVIFYVLSALRTQLREKNYFEKNNLPAPNMADYLDLVALGTVADVVPLDFYNRIFVQQGLLRIRANRTRPGILALIEISKRNARRLVAEDFGFALAPRINAAGRMDDISTGIQCLLCEDLNEARLLATELEDLNRDRKTVERTMQEEALKVVESLHLSEEGLPIGLCVFDEQWHQGVVGLLASRLKEKFHRPAIAFALVDDTSSSNNKVVKGSARSIEGFHIRDALDAIATQYPNLIEKFGGHAMAAGLSIQQLNLPAFIEAFDRYTKKQLSEDQLQKNSFSDGELCISDFNLLQAHSLRNSAPWGQRFPAPLFHGNFKVMHKRLLGDQHIKLVLQPLSDSTTKNNLVDAVKFFIDNNLKAQIEIDSELLITYRLDVNEYNNEESLQLIIECLELA